MGNKGLLSFGIGHQCVIPSKDQRERTISHSSYLIVCHSLCSFMPVNNTPATPEDLNGDDGVWTKEDWSIGEVNN